MKAYVQYYETNCITKKLYAPCGDRSVVVLDGRNNLATMKDDAIRFNGYRRPKYEAYQIFKGDFRESIPVTDIIKL
jgi:hypothetical protein